ncbi:MAG: DUF302 domain-containing protein, partial [Thiohalomonadales bacterium]
PNDVFLIKSSSKSMTEVVESVKSYVQEKKWVYLGDFKVKKGQVYLVKFCVKAAGKLAWKAGLKVSAMLPCGNIGIYQNKGKTEVSMLTPYYMTSLYPNDNLKAAADLLMPMYKDLLTTVVK